MSAAVFVVQHLHLIEGETEDIKFIGVYSSRSEAFAATRRLATQPGFRECSAVVDPSCSPSDVQGFYIDEYQLNQDNWSQGYVTV